MDCEEEKKTAVEVEWCEGDRRRGREGKEVKEWCCCCQADALREKKMSHDGRRRRDGRRVLKWTVSDSMRHKERERPS